MTSLGPDDTELGKIRGSNDPATASQEPAGVALLAENGRPSQQNGGSFNEKSGDARDNMRLRSSLNVFDRLWHELSYHSIDEKELSQVRQSGASRVQTY
jgi:hypothetical protein